MSSSSATGNPCVTQIAHAIISGSISGVRGRVRARRTCERLRASHSWWRLTSYHVESQSCEAQLSRQCPTGGITDSFEKIYTYVVTN